MTLPSLKTAIGERLKKHYSASLNWAYSSIGGGSINEAYRIAAGEQTVFCKINSASKFPHLFSCESGGLKLLARQEKIKTPRVIDCVEAEGSQILLLEWVQEGERDERFWKLFGQQLAALHKVTHEAFGLDIDNYMGSVPQSNKRHNRWTDFFSEERLSPMIKRCAAKRLLHSPHLRRFEVLQKRLPDVFDEENPSLLHGDLWSGNFLCNQSSEPVLIDPAVYFGHRSIDLAMTTLFGGFRQPFYEAYHYHFPLPSNYQEQWAVCNLYPLLIHLYLFGGGYLPQIAQTLKTFE